MKKVLALFQVSVLPPQGEAVHSFLKANCLALGLNQSFEMICEEVLDLFKKYQLIAGEHDHVIAATIIKVTSNLVLRENGFSITTIAGKANCSEYAMKMLLKKAHTYDSEILSDLMRKHQQ